MVAPTYKPETFHRSETEGPGGFLRGTASRAGARVIPLSRFFGDFLAGQESYPPEAIHNRFQEYAGGLPRRLRLLAMTGLFGSLGYLGYCVGKGSAGGGAGGTGAGKQTAAEIGGAGGQIWFT